MPPDSSMYTRVLAAAALGACAVLFIVVLATSGGGDGDKDQQKAKGSQTKSGQSSRPRRRRATRPQGATYRVKAGDTLGSIAEKTGVGVEQLQERNPQLDPQTLVSGQKLKLRE